MPKVLVERKHNFKRTFSKSEKKIGFALFFSGKTKISLVSMVSVMFICIIFCGFFYLYQVNDLATKGFEIKEIENKITELKDEKKKLKIKETELKSMYNLEKEVENMDLVNCSDISYIEQRGPLAMK